MGGCRWYRLRTTWYSYTPPATSYTTQYSGSFTYTNNTLSSIATPAGRLVPVLHNGQVHWKTEYNLTDHLGNVRVVFAAHANGQPEVMQQTSYYPFGYTLQQNDFSAGVTSENKNLYNGKELKNDVLAGSRLDWYDYGARFYDPVVGRWHIVDPLIEMHQDYTPYSYVYNNPIKLLDPNGCDSASDARINEIVKAYISSNPKIHVTINGEVVNEGTSGSYDEAKENNDIDESSLYITFNAVSDNTSIVDDYIDSFKLAALYTGVKLGRSSKKGLAFYGYSFFGNQYTRIIKLKVPINLINSLKVQHFSLMLDFATFTVHFS